jgi:hypothetical protein
MQSCVNIYATASETSTDGQSVYLHKPDSSSLTAISRKLKAFWVGPFAIYKVSDRTDYMLHMQGYP